MNRRWEVNALAEVALREWDDALRMPEGKRRARALDAARLHGHEALTLIRHTAKQAEGWQDGAMLCRVHSETPSIGGVRPRSITEATS